MPPALFVAVVLHRLVQRTDHYFTTTVRAASKPRPNSMPLTAGILKMACSYGASSPSKSGEPMPAEYPLLHTQQDLRHCHPHREPPYGREIFSPAKSLRTGNPCLAWRWEICLDKSSREAGGIKNRERVVFIPATSLRCAAI